ncbi:MAG: GNAT family N-acetyltransferase [Deltaproteobacteria bacterium]|nr:GNAT family N-acetyltransferase [Deltaproteobacteria bacterium]
MVVDPDRWHVPTRAMLRTEADLDLFGQCFAINGSPRPADHLRWQYLDNPTGELFVDFALARNDKLAAIYASMPVTFRIAGQRRLGIQSVDTMTDSEFRGRGLFLTLARQTYARARDAGVALVYGTPNANSAHGFFNRLDWSELGDLPFLIRPLRTKYFLERLGAPWTPDLPIPVGWRSRRATSVDRFDERFTELWRQFSRTIGVAVERDARYLNWRLVEKPSERYETNAIFDGDRVRAFTSHCVQKKERSAVGYVMESLCLPGEQRALRGLLRTCLVDMAKQEVDFALAWCFPHSPTYSSFLRCGFVPLPRRMWPLEIHVGAHAFAPDVSTYVTDRRHWYLSYVDCDTV